MDHTILPKNQLGLACLAMILTNVVADDNKKAHKAAAYTAFASYATAVIVFKF